MAPSTPVRRKITLGEIITLEYGFSLPKNLRTAGSIPVFGSNGQVGLNSTAKVEGPGIVVGRKGSIGKLVFCESDFWPIDTTYFVKTNEDIKYIYYLLSCQRLEKLNRSTGVPGLNRDDVYSIPVTIPNLTEQRRIVQIITSLDEKIGLVKKEIEKYQQLKQGLMTELLSDEVVS